MTPATPEFIARDYSRVILLQRVIAALMNSPGKC
jgi:hypothetical protein